MEEGTLQRKRFVQRRRGTLKRPGALRGHIPLRVAGAQGESQEMAGPDDEEPCLMTEECVCLVLTAAGRHRRLPVSWRVEGGAH